MQTRALSPDEQREFFRRNPPRSVEAVFVSGDVNRDRAKVIAIVGARDCTREAADFAFELARACVGLGAIVASGGAIGVDSAAHRGALAGRGRTWAILGVGCDAPFPEERAELFTAIASSPRSSLIWPFLPEQSFHGANYRKRNGYLVRASDEIVVVQAGLKSGSINTAGQTRRAGRLPWIVPISPWLPPDLADAYAGNRSELRKGGMRVLTTIPDFLSAVFDENHQADSQPDSNDDELLAERSEEEKALLSAATNRPKHLDDLCETSGLSPALAATALLTLALEHVLVEGPPGYYRRWPSG